MSTSLSEVVLAVALFGLLAGIVAPTVESSDSARLDAAAQELAATLRLAQAEAMRVGQPHGVVYNSTTQSLKVSSADPSTEPFVATSDTYHPVKKQPLTWQADWLTLSPADNIFDYGAYGNSNYLMFDAWGTPLLHIGGVYRRLKDTTLSLYIREQRKTVKIEHMTGRVVVQ